MRAVAPGRCVMATEAQLSDSFDDCGIVSQGLFTQPLIETDRPRLCTDDDAQGLRSVISKNPQGFSGRYSSVPCFMTHDSKNTHKNVLADIDPPLGLPTLYAKQGATSRVTVIASQGLMR